MTANVRATVLPNVCCDCHLLVTEERVDAKVDRRLGLATVELMDKDGVFCNIASSGIPNRTQPTSDTRREEAR